MNYIIDKIPKGPSFEWRFILTLRNDVREGFVSQKTISSEEHEDFMRKNHENYFIIWDDKYCLPFGFVGVVDDDIRFAVDPNFQGQGIGKELLCFIKQKYPEAVGKVKIGNAASAKAFTKAGFQVWFSDDQFIYFSPKNIGAIPAQELHKMYNKYLMRCFYCSAISSSSIDGLAVCPSCRHLYEQECRDNVI